MRYHIRMGVLLRSWRERRGFSLRQLAERAGVSYVTIARIEADKLSPTVMTLEKLAAALNITVRDMFPATARRTRRTRKGGQR